jgi:DNA-binding CsgD family transcriptional regulator
VTSPTAELDTLSELCERLELPTHAADVAAAVLEPVAALLGADTASFRVFGLRDGVPRPVALASTGIPESVNAAYFDRYHALDPARRLFLRRLKKPLFADPMRKGEWCEEPGDDITRAEYREDFRRYRRDFLVPNNFFHHVGFCIQDGDARVLLFDFHRPARSREFGALEHARARLVALFLHTQVRQQRATPRRSFAANGALSAREHEVAEAVALGLSNKQVAATLSISVRTVENHMRSIFTKLGVTTRTGLAATLHGASGRTDRHVHHTC